MAEEQYTRCPGCLTVFRVTPAQLALREGQVRCGHCRTVFDGHAQMISLAPLPRDPAEAERDELALGPPTVTLRSPRALEPAPGASARAIPEPSFRTEGAADSSAPRATIRTMADTDQSAREERRSRRRQRRQRRLWAAAVPLLA